MKADIHPKYVKNATVKCACGHTFIVGSTKANIEVEICSQCHPFYTGKEKLVDTAGRIEKFQKKVSSRKASSTPKKTRKPSARKSQKLA